MNIAFRMSALFKKFNFKVSDSIWYMSRFIEEMDMVEAFEDYVKREKDVS